MSVEGQRWPPLIEGGSSGLTDPMTTRGDIIIRDASNVTARLPVGANLQILSTDGTDAFWDDPAGGGGGSGMTGIDAEPASPHAEDEECESSSGFAWVNQGSATETFEDHNLILTAPASSTNSLRIRKKSITSPTGDWKYRVKLVNASKPTVSFLHPGVILREAGTGKIITFAMYSNSGGFQCDRWSDATTYVSTGSGTESLNEDHIAFWGPIVMEIEKSGSNLIWKIVPAIGGPGLQIHTETLTNHFTTGPDEWGIYANSADSGWPGIGVFMWARRVA